MYIVNNLIDGSILTETWLAWNHIQARMKNISINNWCFTSNMSYGATVRASAANIYM